MELSKVTMILRGYTYEEIRCVAEVLITCNSRYIRNMEITLNTDNAISIIKDIVKEFGNYLNIGAGTVQTYDELVQAIDAGAKFVLSPRMMSKEMLDYCKEKQVVSIPGSFTPSEIGNSFDNGANIVKVFPANELSLSYAAKVREPMGDYALMAVGGINKTNVKEALTSGYQYVGTAGGLFSKENIKSKNKEKLIEELKEFEKAID
ncbi:MAG: bifunctional 4-hydroxy-2-oxoglutarate aldolase/2-dehydro-3-deoxy-phosphogluconate aldolase [Anaerorhabdus sp.]|uniref:bifunctional 4-hydroxy-2-oxoglutarate aldolase/2-dehydro-3-deoxy-phosphogluconate aldolase n=1 Tax=Anaerorhabdus sp. TaxID=1872524 RepID=UPI003A8A775A